MSLLLTQVLRLCWTGLIWQSRNRMMQTRGVKSAEATPIQKLLVGLPEGNNHTFFNCRGEVSHLGESMAAIALFNQASNTPSFGGGFKKWHQGTPVTTLIAGDKLAADHMAQCVTGRVIAANHALV